jgi:hypothetical protein
LALAAGGLALSLTLAAEYLGGILPCTLCQTERWTYRAAMPISPASGTGSLDINFTNNGGQQPDLSHLTLTGANAVHVDPPVTATGPASLAILGLGTVALGFLRGRR